MQVFPNISVSFSCGTLNNLFSRVCVLLPFSVTSTTQVLSDILVTQIVPMAVAAYLSISVSSAVVHTALKLTFQSFHYSNLKVSGNGLCQHNVNKAAMLADNSHIMRVFCISAGPTCGAKSSHEDCELELEPSQQEQAASRAEPTKKTKQAFASQHFKFIIMYNKSKILS